MENYEQLVQSLEEVQQNQQRLLEKQTESLNLQREHIQLTRDLLEKSGGSTGGERFQRRGSAMMDKSRQLFLVIIGLLVVLLFYVSWVLFA